MRDVMMIFWCLFFFAEINNIWKMVWFAGPELEQEQEREGA